jgi:hypothetical protein
VAGGEVPGENGNVTGAPLEAGSSSRGAPARRQWRGSKSNK